MSDLHRAIHDRSQAFRPTVTPPFSALRARKRRRDQRRAGAAVGLSVAAVLGVAAGPGLLGVGDGAGPRQVAGPATSPSVVQEDLQFTYGVAWRGTGAGYTQEQDAAVVERCFSLPGVIRGLTLTSLPPQYGGQLIGSGNAQTFRDCVAREAPGASVTVAPLAPADRPVDFQVSYAAQAYDGASDDARLQVCLDLPGVSSPVDPFFTRPPTYNVTVTGAPQVAAFRACLADLDGITVFETTRAAAVGFSLTDVRRGCGPSDFVGVLGTFTGPSGLLDYDGLRAEVRSGGALVGSAPLETSEFIVYPKGGAELPETADVSIVREDGEVLVTQSDVDLRFRSQDPQGLCG